MPLDIGLIFDISQLAISFIDAYSDAAVAVEFYSNDQMPFFYAVFSLFVCGAIIDSFSFVLQMHPNGLDDKKWKVWMPMILILIPFGPLLGFVLYATEKWDWFGKRVKDFLFQESSANASRTSSSSLVKASTKNKCVQSLRAASSVPKTTKGCGPRWTRCGPNRTNLKRM